MAYWLASYSVSKSAQWGISSHMVSSPLPYTPEKTFYTPYNAEIDSRFKSSSESLISFRSEMYTLTEFLNLDLCQLSADKLDRPHLLQLTFSIYSADYETLKKDAQKAVDRLKERAEMAIALTKSVVYDWYLPTS